MAIIRTPKEQVDAYFESERISQSELKLLAKGLRKHKEGFKTTDAMNIGSAVDVILTGAPGQFEEEFYVSNVEQAPSDTEKEIVDLTFTLLLDDGIEPEQMDNLPVHREHVEMAIQDTDWYKGKPGEKRTVGLMEKCNEYFRDKIAAYGRKILSQAEKNTIDSVVMSLKTNEETKKYFDEEVQREFTNMDFYYQLPVYFTYKGQECKALLDLMIVVKNDEGKVISILGCDLKTMEGDTLNFRWNVKKFRYDIQAAWYIRAMQEWAKQNGHDVKAVKNDFNFIVESTTYADCPLVYVLDSTGTQLGFHGDPGMYKDGIELRKPLKGVNELFDEYLWYQQTNFEKDIRLKDGQVLQLNSIDIR